MFFEIAPQLVCIVTNDVETASVYQLGTPFSGFLTHVDDLYWKGTTYYSPLHENSGVIDSNAISYFVCF